MSFTIEQAKLAATGFANDSEEKNCLFKAMPDEDTFDYKKGDPETLESLASLVVNDGVDGMNSNKAESIILIHLEGLYPQYTDNIKKVSDWIVVDGYCATKIVEGGDVNNIADRVAFIEKTPRVRSAPFSDHNAEQGKWPQGPKGCGGADGSNPDNELYGFYPPSRKWCDAELIKMGYQLN